MAGRMTAIDIGPGRSGGQQAVAVHEMERMIPFFLPPEVGVHGDVAAPFQEFLNFMIPLYLVEERASQENH